MRAAIYARKSTEQNVSDDAKSVTRQIERARAFAAARGWTTADEHIYSDDAVSGAEWKHRPEFNRLMAALEPRPPFDVLIVSELSRIGRDPVRAPFYIQKIEEAGVSIWGYLRDRQIGVEDEDHETETMLESLMAGRERRRAQARTTDAMRRLVERGHSAGGRVLGYMTVSDGSNFRQVVDPAQAEIVRRIFALCAEGMGIKRIANALNDAGIANPTGLDRADSLKLGKYWSSTGVREVLHRERYIGQLVYGKTRWDYKGGTKKKVDVLDEAKWFIEDRPDLRIVSDELWEAAHARIASTRAVYEHQNGGRLNGRPESGLESRYLLAGFLRCAQCGGRFVVNKQVNRGRGRPRVVYVCATHRTRGASACPEGHSLPANVIHEAIIVSLRKVLSPEALDACLRGLAEKQADHEAKRQPVLASLAKLDGELKKLSDAIAGGEAPHAILQAINAREAQRRELLTRLEHLDGLLKAATSYAPEAHLAAWKTILPDWHAALTAMGPEGRRYIRRLLSAPVSVTRLPDGTWRYEGRGTLGNVFKGWLGIKIPDAELDSMNALADERNLAAELDRMLEDAASESGDEPQLVESVGVTPQPGRLHNRWCRERGSNPHGLAPKGF